MADESVYWDCGACEYVGWSEREFYRHIVEAHSFTPGADGELAARMSFVLGGEWEYR